MPMHVLAISPTPLEHDSKSTKSTKNKLIMQLSLKKKIIRKKISLESMKKRLIKMYQLTPRRSESFQTTILILLQCLLC